MEEHPLPYGSKIVGFQTQQELEDFLSAQRQAAIDALPYALPSQLGITFGSFVFRVAAPDLAIFGRILREDEFDADEEGQQELDDVRDARTRGLIYGKWHSRVVPEGEYGSAHLIGCWPITPEEFEEAASLHWEVWPALMIRVTDEIERERQEGES